MCSQTGQSRRRVYHPEEQLLQGQLSAGLNKNYATQTLFSKFRGESFRQEAHERKQSFCNYQDLKKKLY